MTAALSLAIIESIGQSVEHGSHNPGGEAGGKRVQHAETMVIWNYGTVPVIFKIPLVLPVVLALQPVEVKNIKKNINATRNNKF